MEALVATIRDASGAAPGMSELGTTLREAKSRAALIIALADLGGVWGLEEVTGALTGLADAACEAAAGWLLAREIAAGRLPDAGGYTLLAMGKMGGGELTTNGSARTT